MKHLRWPSDEKLKAFNKNKKAISRNISNSLAKHAKGVENKVRENRTRSTPPIILRDLIEAIRPENRVIEDGDLFIESVQDTYQYILAYIDNRIEENMLFSQITSNSPFLEHYNFSAYANKKFLIINQDIFVFTPIDKNTLENAYVFLKNNSQNQYILDIEEENISFEITLNNIENQSLTRVRSPFEFDVIDSSSNDIRIDWSKKWNSKQEEKKREIDLKSKENLKRKIDL